MEVDALRVAVIEGTDAGRGAPLSASGRRVRVGSARGCDVMLRDGLAAPTHAELHVSEGGVAIRDLGSRAGTYVGSVRVIEAVVPPGTRVRIGDTILAVLGATPPADLRETLAAEGISFSGPPMTDVAEAALRVAPFSTTVLIEGETGTGKELVARAIHRSSMRVNGPFVIVDCGALPATLLEAELFGHERGAFTGAASRRKGAFEQAHGGTLLLDEIGELPMSSQPALLGVLQRRRFRRVGGTEDVEVDVRVLAATNRDLRAEADAGRFRADLFYRLAAAHLRLPPLRLRLDDLPAMVAHMLVDLTGEPRHPLFDGAAMAALRAHGWRGNARELRAVVERAVTMGKLDLGLGPSLAEPPDPEEAIARSEPTPSSGASYRDARQQAIAAFERAYLANLISTSGGNASEAARVARMDRPHLLKMLRKHGLR
jgi:DNA-binding NtrC family response regulator